MLEEINSYFKNKNKNNKEIRVEYKYFYWFFYFISLFYLFSAILFCYISYYEMAILSAINLLVHIVYIKYFFYDRKYIDLLILIELGSFFLGSLYTGGIYSPIISMLAIIPFAVNSIGYYIRTIEALFICLFMILALYLIERFGMFKQSPGDSLFIVFYNVIALFMLSVYVVIFEYHQQLLEKQRSKLDKLKSEWVSIVSHELRTPLTAIRGAMGLVHNGLAGDLSPKAKELIAIANNNCDRLTRMVNDLLDIEKMERGLISLQLRPCEINTVIKEAAAAYKTQAMSSDIELILHVEEPAIILGDKDKITQVVQNLLSNAIKFSPKKSKIIVKEILHQSYVRIEVIDQGDGIPKEFEPQIFEKFTQADSSSSRQKQGSGLGLAICRSLINLHKGNIGFEPNTYQGTTFWFEVPLYKNSQTN